MDLKTLLAICAAIITTLADENNPKVPESTFYIFCNMDMDAWMMVREMLIQSSMITVKSHLVSLTPDGLVVTLKLQNRMNAAKA